MPGETLSDLTFPARDRSMRRVMLDLSEPETGRPSDNFVTNEDSFARVASDVARQVPEAGVYLGVGPDQNFTTIAHARPSLSFILDFRRRNALVHLIHKAIMMIEPDRAGYLSRLLARRPAFAPSGSSATDLVAAFRPARLDPSLLAESIDRVASILRALGVVGDAEWPEVARVQARLAGPGLDARFLALPMYPTLARLIEARDAAGRPAHFLGEDTWYRAVRSAQRGDRILPIVADLAGSTAMPALAAWLRTRSLGVSLIYLSDVEFFLLRSGRFAAFAANLARLPMVAGAMLIRTSTREIAHPDRFPGDSSTTILRPLATFLEAAQAGRVRTPDDLFS